MPSCFVLGCRSGYKSCTDRRRFFHPPKNKEMFLSWQNSIGRKDRDLTVRSYICDIHFADNLIIKCDKFVINGKETEIPRMRWKLKTEAVPHIFPVPKNFTPAVKRRTCSTKRQTKSSAEGVIEISETKEESDTSSEAVLKSKLDYGGASLSMTVKCEPVFDPNLMEEEKEFTQCEGELLQIKSEENVCKTEYEETFEEISTIKEEPMEEETNGELDMILANCITFTKEDYDVPQDLNKNSSFVEQKQMTDCVQGKEIKEKEDTVLNCDNDSKSIFENRYTIEEWENIVKCNVCEKVFCNKQQLMRHICPYFIEKPYKCYVCGRSFEMRRNLGMHLKIHTAGKPFVCDINCGKGFDRRNNLERHNLTHSGEKLFKCNECGHCFSQRCHLVSHIRIHTKEKPFTCDICGKEFNLRGVLVAHARIHTVEKPYRCEICRHEFGARRALVRHTRTHKSYKCNICGKNFNQRGNLVTHARTHTGEK